MFLDQANTDLFHLGVCKRPGSAGAELVRAWIAAMPANDCVTAP